MLQTCSPSPLPKPMLQSGSRKLLPKVAAESCFPKLRSKAIPQRCFPKLFQSCCSKLPRKAAPQSCSFFPNCSPKLHKAFSPKPLPKVVIESCSEQLLKLPPKVVSESGFPKLLSKATPQSCRSSKQLFVNAAAKPQSCSPQLFPKAVLQSCYRKPRPKEAPQNSAHRLRKQSQCVR